MRVGARCRWKAIRPPTIACTICSFESLADVDTYFSHPAHQRFIQEHRAIWLDTLVLNAEVDA